MSLISPGSVLRCRACCAVEGADSVGAAAWRDRRGPVMATDVGYCLAHIFLARAGLSSDYSRDGKHRRQKDYRAATATKIRHVIGQSGPMFHGVPGVTALVW